MKRISLFFVLLFATITVSKQSAEGVNMQYVGTERDKNKKELCSQRTFTINGVSFKMIGIEGGTFKMGAQSSDASGANYDDKAQFDEIPVHEVTLSSFCLGETEVTQELWKAVMGADNNPSHFKNDNNPVEQVSWNDVQTFITKLNKLTGETFRLPTEAEWEYAARGGNKSKGYKYAGSNTIDDVAWYLNNNSTKQTHKVASKAPNELGLYDMSGNVFEWCCDWYGDYSSDPQTNPTGVPTCSIGSLRVIRGGGWGGLPAAYRVSIRGFCDHDYSYHSIGFRLAL